MGKIRIEIDDDDTEIAARLRAYADKVQSQQRAYKAHYDSLPESERATMPLPVEDSLDKMFERALRDGAAVALFGARPPNAVVCVNSQDPLRTYARGECFGVTGVLPVGAEIIAMETSREDGSNFLVQRLSFGNMPLVGGSWYGGECVPLPTFRYATRHDLLCVFDHHKTIVDMQVCATLICKKDGATFDGFRLHLFQEENCCIISPRLQVVVCDHPEKDVVPIVFVDPPPAYGRYSTLPGLTTIPLSVPHGRRYRCTRCGRAVVKEDEAERARAR